MKTASYQGLCLFQFCANNPEVFLQAALLAQDYCDAIDLNLGCPQMIAKRGTSTSPTLCLMVVSPGTARLIKMLFSRTLWGFPAG